MWYAYITVAANLVKIYWSMSRVRKYYQGFFEALGTRFGSLKLKIWSLE